MFISWATLADIRPINASLSLSVAAPTLRVVAERLIVPLTEGQDGAVAIGHGPITDVDRRSVEVLCRTAAAAKRTLRLVAAATLNDKLALIGRMSASVAHEMNNPLAYVTLNLDLLDEQTAGPAPPGPRRPRPR